MLENIEPKKETMIENILNSGGHQGSARFHSLIRDNNVQFSGIGMSRKEDIGKVILEIINKIGNKYGISLWDVTTGKSYAKIENIIDGIAFSFNNSDSESDIKGNVYVGFLYKEEKPIYIIHTHIDMLEKMPYVELNNLAKELIVCVKNNKLKIDLKSERHSGESYYGDPVIYRIGKKFEVGEFVKFLEDIEIIANKFPLCGREDILT